MSCRIPIQPFSCCTDPYIKGLLSSTTLTPEADTPERVPRWREVGDDNTEAIGGEKELGKEEEEEEAGTVELVVRTTRIGDAIRKKNVCA